MALRAFCEVSRQPGETDRGVRGSRFRCAGRAAQPGGIYFVTAWPPRNEVDEYHDLKVEVGKPDFTAHTPTGYYDEPAYYHQPYPVTKRVTVEQLEQMLAKAHGSRDEVVAQELAGMELTERLSSTKLSFWKAALHGEKVREALAAVADASAFLNPPAAKIPVAGPPDLTAQRPMLSGTIDYLSKTIPKLPDFFATRTTVGYGEPPQKDEQTWKTATGRCIRRAPPLHPSSTAMAAIRWMQRR